MIYVILSLIRILESHIIELPFLNSKLFQTEAITIYRYYLQNHLLAALQCKNYIQRVIAWIKLDTIKVRLMSLRF